MPRLLALLSALTTASFVHDCRSRVEAGLSGSLHENISRIGEDAKIRSEPEFQPSACMAKGCFDRVPFVSATAEHVGRQRKRVQRPAKYEVPLDIIYEVVIHVFGISFSPDADVPIDEVIQPQARPETAIMPDSRA